MAARPWCGRPEPCLEPLPRVPIPARLRLASNLGMGALVHGAGDSQRPFVNAAGESRRGRPWGTQMPDRESPPTNDEISFGPFRLASAKRLLEKAGTPVKLGSRALDILIGLTDR